MNRKPLKLAFIGGGNNSAVGYVHFCASQLDNYFKVVAGAFSRNKQVNIETADKWGIAPERTYNNWKTLLESEKDEIDAVAILTPTPNHLEALLYALELNIPIICEKSLVSGPSEIEQLEKVYDKSKHYLAVTYNYSGYPMVRELKQRISKGQLGKIQKIVLEMPQEGFKRPPDIAGKKAMPQAWRLQDGEVPTICLDLGVHLHHMAHFLTGQEPCSVLAQASNHSDYNGLVDDMQLLLKYTNDVVGSMWISKTAIGHRNGLNIRVYGDQGSAFWHQLNPDELQLNYASGLRETLDRGSECEVASIYEYNRMKPGHPSGFIEAFANLYRDFANDLYKMKGGKRIEQTDFLISKMGLMLFSKAYQSSKKNY
ncbi:Gfo/Idh/MocA family protein [Pseudoalteromonas sp. SS15]|uniref:Gfo/Idh/MocA family protein n=1 Tax=Pseudoalteromonas sp. SS15 TaxID=3139393 RepID=UPI003BAB7590